MRQVQQATGHEAEEKGHLMTTLGGRDKFTLLITFRRLKGKSDAAKRLTSHEH